VNNFANQVQLGSKLAFFGPYSSRLEPLRLIWVDSCPVVGKKLSKSILIFIVFRYVHSRFAGIILSNYDVNLFAEQYRYSSNTLIFFILYSFIYMTVFYVKLVIEMFLENIFRINLQKFLIRNPSCTNQ
jgi:hypothetical protein